MYSRAHRISQLTPVLLCCALLSGCAGSPVEPADEPAPARAAGSPAPSIASSSSCTPAPLERRAAAVLVVGIPHVDSAGDPLGQQVVDLGVGGLFLSEPNVESADQVRDLVAGLRARAGRPLLVSTDEESGRVAVTRAVVGAGPSPRRLARESSPEEVREYAAGIGAQLADLGIDLDLAPVLDLDDGSYDGIIGDRSFSAEPEEAAEYGLAFAAGLADEGVTPVVKHFPGQGRSATDTHAESALVETPLDELRGTDLLPFQRAIDAGAPVVMLNHLSYGSLDPDLPASLSPRAYALLREMGFEGVAMTDSVGMGAINLKWDFPEAAVRAVEAGADSVLATDGNRAEAMRDALVAAVRSGRLPEERLSEAAARVTALAGGDAMAMSCVEVDLPSLSVAGAGAPVTTPVP